MKTYAFISVLKFRGLKCPQSNGSPKLSTGGEKKQLWYLLTWDLALRQG